MKLFLILCLVAAVFADDVSDDDIKKWKDFKVKHGKMFMSKNKEAARMKNFLKHSAKIEAINEKFAKGESTYTAKTYAHHDLSPEEFKARFCGLKKDNSTAVRMAPVMRQSPPDSLDLSTTPEVGDIKDQGQCGSCWTFSTTAATESRYYRNTGNPIILSEQELVNCVSGCNGCNGGWMPTAFDWIQTNGQTIESNVPYQAVDGTCTIPAPYFYAKGQAQIPSDATSIQNALNTQGVLAICVDATQWNNYGTGIFSIPSDDPTISTDHAVALVGYGTDTTTGIPYWKIRNSWGTGWGENGYIRVPITADVGQSSTYNQEETFAVL